MIQQRAAIPLGFLTKRITCLLIASIIIVEAHDLRIADLDRISIRHHDVVNDPITADENAVGAPVVGRVDQVVTGSATPSLVPSCSSSSRTRLSTRDLAL